MLDQLSHEPSPTGHEAVDEIVSDIIFSRKNMYLISFTEKDKKKLYDISYKIISKNPPIYSYTCWIMGGKEEYVDMTINAFINIEKSKKYIRSIIKTLGFLYRIYRNTQERMYAPGGKFEIESSLIWNPILKNPNTPPPPPFS